MGLLLVLSTLCLMPARADEARFITPNLVSVDNGGFNNPDDAVSSELEIGFTFYFGGVAYTRVRMSSNGILYFQGGGSEYSNTDLSMRGDALGIYPLWDDLYVGDSIDETLSRALFWTTGEEGSRVFIMQWSNWYSYGEPYEVGTFNVVLHEGSNVIDIYYRNMLGTSLQRAYGLSATIGIVASSSYYSQYSFNAPVATEGKLLTYTPAPGGESPYTLTVREVTPATAASIRTYYLSYTTAPRIPINLSAAPDPVSGSATLTWDLSALGEPPTAYKIRYATNPQMTGLVETAPFVSEERSYVMSGLVAGATYYWQAISTIDGQSSVSTISEFTQAVNNPPIASDGSFSTPQNTMHEGFLTAIDIDHSPENSGLIFSIASPPARGSAILTDSSTGAFIYTPEADFSGADSFTFKAFDGTAYSDDAIISITVTTVNSAPVVAVPIPDQTGTYGSAFVFAFDEGTFTDADGDPLSYAVSGLPPGIDFNDLSRTFAGVPISAGAYVVEVMAGDGATMPLTATNSFVFTVSKAPLVIIADDKTRGYGAANPELTFTYEGWVNDENSEALETVPVIHTVATAASPVGSYPITLNGGSAANYALTLMDGELVITQAGLVIIADDKTRGYGAANPELTFTYEGWVNDENSEALETVPVIHTVATAASPVGSYPITLSGGSAANYALTLMDGELVITQAGLVISADDKTRGYGAANPELTFTYEGWVNDENSEALETVPVIHTVATAASPVGSYPITLNGGSAANYALTLMDGELVITQAGLVISADNKTRGYGAANPELTFTYEGWVNDENSEALETVPVIHTVATAASPVGSYPITLSGGSAANYALTLMDGELVITQAGLVISADDKTRGYGAANPELTFTYEGWVNDENSEALETVPVIHTEATAASPVGSYPITLNGGSAANYALTLMDGELVITQAGLVISADDKTRGYGAANPELTFTYEGWVNDENSEALETVPVIHTEATAASPVGSYPITLNGGSAANYALTLMDGELVITQAGLVISADDKSRGYGAANPELTCTIKGLLNDDTISVEFECVANPTSPAGAYPIVPLIDDTMGAAANYGIEVVEGTLTIVANDPPVIVLSESPGLWTLGKAPTRLDAEALVADAGRPHFDGGTLTITTSINASNEDQLTVQTQGIDEGEVGTIDAEVTFGGAPFGIWSGGTTGEPVVVTLNTNATASALTAFIRHLAFSTTDGSTGSRTFEFILSDGADGVSEPVFRNLRINRPPQAMDDLVTVAAGVTVGIPLDRILGNDTDADGDTITLAAHDAVSVNGATITFDGAALTYHPLEGLINEDWFAYVIEDGIGGECAGVVTLRFILRDQLTLEVGADHQATLGLAGVPGQVYAIETSSDLVEWTLLELVTADSTGLIQIVDSSSGEQYQRFYRALQP
jgi:hypothetical protein